MADVKPRRSWKEADKLGLTSTSTVDGAAAGQSSHSDDWYGMVWYTRFLIRYTSNLTELARKKNVLDTNHNFSVHVERTTCIYHHTLCTEINSPV